MMTNKHYIPFVWLDGSEERENPLFRVEGDDGNMIVDLRGCTVISDSIFLPMKRKAERSLWRHLVDVLRGWMTKWAKRRFGD